MSITPPLPLVSEAAKLFVSEDVTVPSTTETSHNGDLMAKSSRHVGRLLRSCATFGVFVGQWLKQGERSRLWRCEGLRFCAQALIPVLDMAPSGLPSHPSMRDAWPAVHKTHEVFGQIFDAQLWVTANTASECWRLTCKLVYSSARTRAVIEDAVVKSMVAHIKLPVNAGGNVCARGAGGELEAAAKTRDGADFARRCSSHVRRFRRRPAAGARSRLVDRVIMSF